MKEDEDFLTPEETQAKANSAKINKFMGKIGWQLLILTIVVYATYMNNPAAQWMLVAYTVLVAVSAVVFFLLTSVPTSRLAENSPPGMDEILLDTPSSKVIRVIGTVFSIVEISLMVSYGFFFTAGIWAIAEVFQYIAAFKLKAAREIIPFEDDEAEQIEFEEVLSRIDLLIDLVKDDNTITDAAADDAVKLLLVEREKVVELHERYLAAAQDDK